MKTSETVEVYRPGAPTTTGRPKDVMIMRPIFKPEARLLVTHGFATWRGRSKRAITTTVPTADILLFIGQMRFKDRSETRAIDSKTHSCEGSTNPWRRVRHVRNEHYHPEVRSNWT